MTRRLWWRLIVLAALTLASRRPRQGDPMTDTQTHDTDRVPPYGDNGDDMTEEERRARAEIEEYVGTGEQPLFEMPPDRPIEVTVNVTRTNHRDGDGQVIAVLGMPDILTAAQAHRLARDLADASDWVGGRRQDLGDQ